jgi:predicted transcriptional regulator
MKVSPVEEVKEAKEKEAQVVNEEAVGEMGEVTVEAMGAVLVEGKDAAAAGKAGAKEEVVADLDNRICRRHP